MKILVFSDSHSTMWFMRECVDKIKPDAIIHLGDHYDDGQTLAELYPAIPVTLVPGNCDTYRAPACAPMILCTKVCGALLYMTHGHTHHVKMTTASLESDARKLGAAAALYGHTHIPDCRQEPDLWILNPGTAGNGGKTAGIIETCGGAITDCRIITQEDLEEIL